MSVRNFSPIGSQRYVLDEKNRVRLPATFVEECDGEKLYILPGIMNDSLYVMPKSVYDEKHSFLGESNIYDEEAQLVYSAIRAKTHEANVDQQNRIVVPEDLKNMIGGDKEVVMLTKMDFLEIWGVTGFNNRPELVSTPNIRAELKKLGAMMAARGIQ